MMRERARADAPLEWEKIHRVLLVRLRSIGDTVLMTPCLVALKQWRPTLHLAVVSEQLAAPLLEDHPAVDEVIVLDRRMNQLRDVVERLRVITTVRHQSYDLAVNLHGGPTAMVLTYLSGAPERLGYRGYRYGWMLTRRAPNPDVIWGKRPIHSVEQQIGLLKWAGLPIPTIPPTSLRVSEQALQSARRRLRHQGIRGPFVLIHPAATEESKRWSSHKFAQVIKHLARRYDLPSVVIVARHEAHLAENIKGFAASAVHTMSDLNIKEVIALAAQASLFIGNDSGPAHIAAATGCPTIVIFGSSDPDVWRPWGLTPHVVVHVASDPRGVRLPPAERIKHVRVEHVIEAVDRLLATLSLRDSADAEAVGEAAPQMASRG